MNEMRLNEDVKSGIHPFARQKVEELFDATETKIVDVFANFWYVTKADNLKIGASEYRYLLVKAPSHLANLLNISAEIVVIFSSYDSFEPRTFDAYDNVKNKLEMGRVENLCGILVSKDEGVEAKIKIYNSEKETRTIIPFSYNDILSHKGDQYLFRNKFQKCFYSRDLFAFDDALKTDLYFFGRNQLVLDIINRHLSGQNTGLFGLRKTGKTSLIFDVQRKIEQRAAAAIFVSCQNPEMSSGTWIDSVFYIVKCLYEQLKMDVDVLNKDAYTNLTAISNFEKEIEKVNRLTGKTILLMFDEVEHITYGKASEQGWGDGIESVNFWKGIRSAYQTKNSKFTYCIIGTNPICVEYPTIKQADNPIFCGVTPLYIPGFDVEQTRSMVRKLGRIMGIKFDEILYSKMTEEYGGHPFLIRHLCSFIAEKYPDRPVVIDRVKYNLCKEEFDKTQGKYFDMLLEVLKEFYNDEYEMLKYLAAGDIETFNYFAKEDFSLVQHLIGYGIISAVDGNYDFKMDVLKEYLLRKEGVKQKLVSKEEKWSYICVQRGRFETELRKITKQILLFTYLGKGGEAAAKEYVMSKIYNDRESRRKYCTYEYSDLFDPKKSKIFLKNLTTLILGEWTSFIPFMGDITQEDFVHMMGIMNVEGRFDAHAKDVSDDDIILFDATLNKLGEIIKKYNAFTG